MKIIQAIKTLPAVALLGLTACSTVDVAEMSQLDGNATRAALLGKTQTFTTEYGKWAEYIQPNELSGAGRAWGDWGSEKATAVHTISEDGELCTQYQGEHEWSTDQHQFCAVYYVDEEGAIYSKATKNTFKPQNVGKVDRVAIAEGDKYNLMN